MMARKIMATVVAGAIGIGPALAEGYEATVLQKLERQGFRDISTERTWLGRTRIVAENSEGQREIIMNPNNGEILRDLWLVRDGGDNSDGQASAVATAGSGSEGTASNGGVASSSAAASSAAATTSAGQSETKTSTDSSRSQNDDDDDDDDNGSSQGRDRSRDNGGKSDGRDDDRSGGKKRW